MAVPSSSTSTTAAAAPASARTWPPGGRSGACACAEAPRPRASTRSAGLGLRRPPRRRGSGLERRVCCMRGQGCSKTAMNGTRGLYAPRAASRSRSMGSAPGCEARSALRVRHRPARSKAPLARVLSVSMLFACPGRRALGGSSGDEWAQSERWLLYSAVLLLLLPCGSGAAASDLGTTENLWLRRAEAAAEGRQTGSRPTGGGGRPIRRLSRRPDDKRILAGFGCGAADAPGTDR